MEPANTGHDAIGHDESPSSTSACGNSASGHRWTAPDHPTGAPPLTLRLTLRIAA
jgi:hypothetical protein